MATREETRRELRELAKLAEVIPKERTTITPPAPDPSMPSAEAAPLLPAQGAPSQAGFLSPFTPTDSIAPAAASTPPSAPASARPWGWVVAAGGTLAAAMVGGLLLGQALASHPASRAAASGGPAVGTTDTRVEAPVAKPATPPAPVAAPAPPAETASTLVVTDEGDKAVTVRAPKPAHHGVKKTPKAAPKDTGEETTPHKASSAGGSGSSQTN